MISYRKTKQGEWVLCGLTAEMTLGLHTVTTKAGKQKQENVIRLGDEFQNDAGEVCRYGYISNVASKPARGARPSASTAPVDALALKRALDERDDARRLLATSREMFREASDTIQDLRDKLAAGPGHGLTDDICRTIAEKAGRATIDAILGALGSTRRKPTADEEQARIARMTPLPEGTTPRARTLDTDEASEAGTFCPICKARKVGPCDCQVAETPTPTTIAMLSPKKRTASSILDRLKKV